MRLVAAGVLALALAGCAARPPLSDAHTPAFANAHTPGFASKPYEALSRQSVVAIALREWRLWGELVDDDPPGSRPPRGADEKPERWPGLWQRVGEYWWLGVDPGAKEAGWTGKHDEWGMEFPAEDDARYAWSAAFISYVLRTAGAGSRFPYSPTHSDYINAAAAAARDHDTGFAVVAERIDSYRVLPGDLICMGRGWAAGLRFENLPAGVFPSHCDIVVAAAPGSLAVVGGNVDDAVTMKHVPTTPEGRLAGPDGVPVDARYPWLVALRIIYDTPTS